MNKKEVVYSKLDEMQARCRIDDPKIEHKNGTIERLFGPSNRSESSHILNILSKRSVFDRGPVYVAPFTNILNQPKKSADDLWRKQCLILRIDLTAADADILSQTKEFLEYYSQFIEKPKRRVKKNTIVDPWVVYDLHHEENLDFKEIAKRYFKIKRPFDLLEDGDRSKYRMVTQAYKRATEAIDFFRGKRQQRALLFRKVVTK